MTVGFEFIEDSTQELNATTTSDSVPIQNSNASAYQVLNNGENLVFIKLGNSTDTASSTGYPLFGGNAYVNFRPTGATHVHIVSSTGTSQCYISEGVRGI